MATQAHGADALATARPLRVLHVIPSLSPLRGGPSAALPVMERALARQGIAVETATTDDDGPRDRAPRPGRETVGEAIRHTFPRRAGFYTWSPAFSRWIARHAADYDVIHAHALFSHVSIAAALAARRQNVPYILRPLGTLMRYGLAQKPLMKRLSLSLFERRILADAAAVHFTSEVERVEAEDLGLPLRPAVIPLGIEAGERGDGERFLLRHPEARDRPRLLFLSRVHEKKNLEALIDALPRLANPGAGAVLVVCGDGHPDYVAALRRRATERGVAERIIWTGFLQGAEKADALAAADLFVLPSHSENFGIAALEALLAGVPAVLGRGVALASEIEAEGAGLAVEPTAAELARGIERVLDPAIRREAATAARRVGRARYSADAMGAALAGLYGSVVAGTQVSLDLSHKSPLSAA